MISVSCFKDIANLIFAHAAKTPSNTVRRFYRHAVTNLFKYLMFEPL